MAEISDVDWQTFDPSTVANSHDCGALMDAITKEMADIEGQLDIADARRELNEPVDPMWYARAKSALKYRGRMHQIISRKLGELARIDRPKSEARGCICPPTSEQTCMSPLCPRRGMVAR